MMALIVLTLMRAHAETVTLLQALAEAERNSPRMKSVAYQGEAANQGVRSARANYLPTVDAAAIAVDGNPGGFSMLNVDSNVGAAQRIGVGGAVTLRQNIWDFGRTDSAVDVALSERQLNDKNSDSVVADVGVEMLRTYLHCAFLKSESDVAQFTAREASVIARETNQYIRSGQRSVVERYFVEAQAKEAETLFKELGERIKMAEQRLAIKMGRDSAAAPSCERLSNSDQSVARLPKVELGHNPLLEVSRVQENLARLRIDQARSETRPWLIGLANGGYLQDRDQKVGWNYSAGVGLSFPLFDGLHREAQIDMRRAELEAQKARVEASAQYVDEANSQLQEQTQAIRVRLASLEEEHVLATKAFTLARQRYFSLKGTMIDLREALRNLTRVKLARDESQRDYLLAKGSYALFNGAKPLASNP